MIPYYGDYPVNHSNIVIALNTFRTSTAPAQSITITDFATTDIHIHRNASITQRSSVIGVNRYIDFDGITGNHIITIDASDDTDPGYYAAGGELAIRLEGATVDGGTINAFVATLSIERAGGVLALLKTLTTNHAKATSDIAAILVDTGTTLDGKISKATTDIAAVLVDTATTLDGKINTISTNVSKTSADVAAILVDTGATIPGVLTDIKGGGWQGTTDSLQMIRDRGDAAWITGGGGSVSADIAIIKANVSKVSTDVAAILVDTGTTLDAKISKATADISALMGTGFQASTDALQMIRDRGDAAWITGGGISVSADVAAIKAVTDLLPDAGALTTISTNISKVSTDVAAILVDTNELQTDDIPGTLITIAGYIDTEISTLLTNVSKVSSDVAEILIDTGTTLDNKASKATSDIATLLSRIAANAATSSDVTAIKAVTDSLTVAAAVKLALSLSTCPTGTVVGTKLTTTTCDVDLLEATDDHLNGRLFVPTSGALKDQYTRITDYDGTGKYIMFVAMTEAMASGDTFLIM